VRSLVKLFSFVSKLECLSLARFFQDGQYLLVRLPEWSALHCLFANNRPSSKKNFVDKHSSLLFSKYVDKEKSLINLTTEIRERARGHMKSTPLRCQ
jgi:hypothetical protein